MYALGRTGGRQSINIWPGFVDGLASLLLVVIFVLMVFMIAQYFLSVALSGPDLARAERQRTVLHGRLAALMERFDFLVLPVNQVPPFDIDIEYPREIDGVAMETYIDWMKSASFVTLTGHPAISVPGGFTDEGLPVGVQVVGRHHDDFGVLQVAHAFEQATGHWKRRPSLGD